MLHAIVHAADIQDRSSYLSGASVVRLAEGRYDEALRCGVEADAVARGGFSTSSQQSNGLGTAPPTYCRKASRSLSARSLVSTAPPSTSS